MEYPKLVSWSVQNFLAIEKASCEFDETGIIFLKGYNDSGKSAMLRALDVLFFNAHPRDQVMFIQDDKEYFRIVARFSDGVSILRDKYINGQSLYEMYKEDKCIYSTRVNGVLTKISGVPEPIEVYLGLVPELTVRTCYDKQFLVQTSGSENYKDLSAILRTEEIAKASELLNSDKNKLQSDISGVEQQLEAYKAVVKDGTHLTEGVITYLEGLDKSIDSCDAILDFLSKTRDTIVSARSIVIAPEVATVDYESLSDITRLASLSRELGGIRISPEIQVVDSEQVHDLSRMTQIHVELSQLRVVPEVPTVDMEELSDLAKICSIHISDEKLPPVVNPIDYSELHDLEAIMNIGRNLPDIEEYDKQLEDIDNEIKSLVAQIGDAVIVCPDCGHVITQDEIHSH